MRSVAPTSFEALEEESSMDTPTRTVGASVVDRRRSAEVDSFGDIVGQSGGFRQAVQRARLLSKVDAPVLLEGETGVGKDVFARAIHGSSRHWHGPFVALNCGGLPRDLIASELFGYVDGAFTGA